MAMNNLEMLGDYMFEEMERLNNIDLEDESGEPLEGEELDKRLKVLDAEVKRAKQLGVIAGQITKNNRTAIEVMRFKADYCGFRSDMQMPNMLTAGDGRGA